MSKAGRKQVYSTEFLKRIVNDYMNKYAGKKVGVLDLVAFSGIGKNTWYRSQEILDYINLVNNPPKTLAKDMTSYPTVNELYNSTGGEEEKVKETLAQLLDIIEELSKRPKNTNVARDEEVMRLMGIIKEKDKIIEQENVKLNAYVAGRDDLSNIRDNKDKLDVSEFEKQFGYLLS